MKTAVRLRQPAQITIPAGSKRRSSFADAWYQLTRNRVAVLSLAFLIALLLVALSADLLRNAGLIEGIDDQHRGSSLAAPMTCATRQPNQQPYPVGSPEFCFIFGADQLGRDVLSRTVYGARVSLAVAAIGATISLTLASSTESRPATTAAGSTT